MKFSVRGLRALAVGALVPAALLVSPLAANAQSYTYNGSVAGGVDPLGGSYSLGANALTGDTQFSETANDQSDTTQDPTFQPGSSGLLDATSFTFTELGTAIDPISESYGTGFTQDNVGDWTAVYTTNAQGVAYQVQFIAPTGDTLAAGSQFFTTVDLTSALPSGFAYTLTYAGDAAVSAAPEPAAWLLMLAGVGAMGAALRIGRRRAFAMAAA